MYYKFEDLPKEYKVDRQRLYAFDYATNNTEKSKALKAEPYLCELRKSYRESVGITSPCYKVKNDGKIGKASVQAGSRCYALTLEEAISGYNDLVMDTVGFLVRLARVYERDML